VTRADRALAGVEALLEQQRRALLAGDLAALAQMPDRLAQALTVLAQHGLPSPVLARVQAAAGHNARLLLAAQRGVSQARGRREGERADALSTYDASGQRAACRDEARVLSRR